MPLMTNMDISQSSTKTTSSAADGCSCVSVIHRALDQVRDDDLCPDFYASLSLFQSARKTAEAAVACRICPKKYMSAMQNSLALCTLVVSISDSYETLLRSLNEDEECQDGTGKQKTIHIQGGARQSLTIPTFKIALDHEEWRTLGKKAMRAEIYGDSSEASRNQCFSALIERLEKRQREWHTSPPGVGFPPSFKVRDDEPKPPCLALVTAAKKSLERLKLS